MQGKYYQGYCAACGARWGTSNFRGRRSGIGIPNPCFIELRNNRPESDDRLCFKCYDEHRKRREIGIAAQVTPQPQRLRSRSGSLDGSHWTTDSSERAAKVMRRISSGELVIPVAVHEEKMEELKIAERMATETRMLALECTERNFDEGFAIQRFLGCKRIAEDDKTVLVEALIEWYKEKPSRERADSFSRNLSNQAAQKLAGRREILTMKSPRERQVAERRIPGSAWRV
jgi:hypothetical protein